MSTATALIGPLTAAVDRHRSKRSLPTRLRSRDLVKLRGEILDRAFISSAVDHTRTLDALRLRIDDALTPDTAAKPTMSKDRFITEMRRALGVDGTGDSGDLADLGSRRRLALIYKMNVEEAHAYANWLSGQDSDVLDAFPAQELVRFEDREIPRDWFERWESVGGTYPAGGDRLVAMKDSPIWAEISRFGRPWPPFDFGSGMGLRDVSRAEAERVGLMKKGAPAPRPQSIDFNANFSVPVASFSPEALDELLAMFDGRARVVGDHIVWDPPAGGAA